MHHVAGRDDRTEAGILARQLDETYRPGAEHAPAAPSLLRVALARRGPEAEPARRKDAGDRYHRPGAVADGRIETEPRTESLSRRFGHA